MSDVLLYEEKVNAQSGGTVGKIRGIKNRIIVDRCHRM